MKNAELKHFGVLGMKWGVRRYQNKDGTLTAAGKQRYGKDDKSATSSGSKGSSSKTNSVAKNPFIDKKGETFTKGQVAMQGLIGVIGNTLITGVAATTAYNRGNEELAGQLLSAGGVMETIIITDTVARMRKAGKGES